MNYRIIVRILGTILRVEAIAMIPSLLIEMYYSNWQSAGAFAVTIVLLAAVSFIGGHKIENKNIYAREGFIIVALSWILISFFGALPFYFSGQFPSFIDALFETASGFSTTGSTILTNVESLSKGILFWRSLTHWLGGMGVLVFLLTFFSLAGGRSQHLLRAESTGPNPSKLVPKMKHSAMILYGIYVTLTVVEIILLLVGGMPLFDSIVHAFGTAGTGGFSIKNESIAAYGSVYLEMVISVFMILFGINFNIYFFMLMRNFKGIWRNQELKAYLGIITASVVLIAVNLYTTIYNSAGEALRYSLFQVTSIISSAGYGTADYNTWPEFSKVILLVLMFIGACAGSTGGGSKVSRIMILIKDSSKRLKQLIHPKAVYIVKMDGNPLEDSTIRNVYVYFSLLVVMLVISTLVISLDGFDLGTTVSAVVTCSNNIGPGFNMVGPAGNFSAFSWFSKLVLSFNMIAGRLEIFPMVLLFMPSAWKAHE